jgi:hypothetical protein
MVEGEQNKLNVLVLYFIGSPLPKFKPLRILFLFLFIDACIYMQSSKRLKNIKISSPFIF